MKDRPTSQPGGCECSECGAVFIGGPQHDLCGNCASPATEPDERSEREASDSAIKLAEMILSDCGHSTAITTALRDRVALRIDKYTDALAEARALSAPTAPAPTEPRKHDDVDLLLRAVFELCEATEEAPEVAPKNEHQRGFDKGRRFEAKSIRRAVGDWFQATFCGQSFMGEPALATPPGAAAQPEAVPVEYLIRARWPDGIEQYLEVRGVYQLRGGKVGIDVNAPDCHPLASAPTTEATSSPSDADRLDWPAGKAEYHASLLDMGKHMAKERSREIGDAWNQLADLLALLSKARRAAIRATKGGEL